MMSSGIHNGHCIDINIFCMQNREQIIQDYINAYNRFDIEGMLGHFAATILFEHITNGTVVLSLSGLPAFRQQAEQAIQLFAERQQTVLSYRHEAATTEVEIVYKATLAADLPNGMKQGERLQLTGKSVFTFSGDTITSLRDYS